MTVISGQLKNSYDPDVIIAILMQPFGMHYKIIKDLKKKKKKTKEERNKQKKATTKYYNLVKT